MRNLVCLNRGRIQPTSSTAPDLPIKDSVFDPVNDSLTIILGPGDFGIYEIQQFTRDGKVKTLASFPSQEELISFAHFADSNQLVCIFANGDIITATYDSFNEEIDPDQTIVEIVGSIDNGLQAASWSSDEETLVLVTNEKTIILLSRLFEPIAESTLQESDSNLSNHVDVGWGSKETQFKGKGAKQLERDLIKNLDLERDTNKRDPTMPLYVDNGDLSTFDNHLASITWRSDCEFFAVSTIDNINNTDRRMIRVFSREGVLENVSEPVDFLENQLSWGNLISSIQRRTNVPEEDQSLDLVFFEKNGLRHLEFDTRLSINTKIDDILWNSTNEALAIKSQNKIYLWTTKNYHWYLKQEINSVEDINFMKWHPEKNLRLLIGTNSKIEIIDFAYKTTIGPSVVPLDVGMNIVVDGSTVNLTPLSIANVPPPISYRDFDVDGNVLDVAVSKSNEIFAALTNESISFANVDLDSMKSGKHPQIISSMKKSEFATSDEHLRQVAFTNDDIVGVLLDSEAGISRIILIDVSDLNDPYVKSSIDSSLKIVLMKSQADWSSITYETVDGSINRILKTFNPEIEDDDFNSVQVAKFPQLCNDYELAVIQIDYGQIEDEYEIENEWSKPNVDSTPLVAFGISSNGKLFANEVQLTSAVTSLKITEGHLIFTTAQHVLRFVHLNTTEFKPLIESTDATSDERVRQIERGSLLANVIPSKSAVVLQAPRGNLETINPRIMVLQGVRKDIKNRNYKNAFITCRTHRIDLDLLHDYDPELFIQNIELFVKQIERIDYLDLFVSCLHEDDVAKTKYQETYSDEEIDQKVIANHQLQQQQEQNGNNDNYQRRRWVDPKDSKINKICEAILAVLLTPPYKEKYLQTIITAYACEKPANLTDALSLISSFTNKEDAEKSVVHLCFLQDVNVLYNTALGLYDIKLTLAIAQHSQKDPKEYLPFLQNLHSQTELRRKFLIDTHLKKFEKAIVHLSEIIKDDEEISEEFKNYVVEHELYKVALGIYRYEHQKQNSILDLYAKNLYSKQEYVEAGITYELLGNLEDALEAYILGQKWREALAITEREEFKDQMIETAERLIGSLTEAHKYSDAATIEFKFLGHLEEAIRLYCKEYFYEEAILLAQKEKKPEFIEDIVDSSLGDGFGTIAELIADCKGQLTSQLRRLRELRTKKEEDPYAFFGQIEDSDAADNVSVAPSETSTKESFFTRYTGKTGGTAKTGASRRTAKNKRREERKRARGKKNTIYEEEYLVKSIGRLIERLDQTKPEAIRLIEGLIRRGKREQAYQVQKTFVDLIEELKENIVEIYNISEKDRERIDENGEVYYIPEIPVPEIKDFPKKATLDY
ncbi:Elongator complex protein [Wickerhamomyces ciferrii]|uniref:Elongator complex protein 1 n=1 Tax=Wickerhamomyces ciferrii (strain ATCC 14091 / BCRC 22168 / CBS 111 / JCM 3599 / NBRC 0793 / NRRL Y-1031 F-60-10) TaxID=1206466 RepID=K0KUD1_WICCF|nr:Elongator complex protein [Wickerhamomyces ciferrii]CCH44803.1 Elongator complex protein [Wickerhamomyces ciferrii]